MYYDTYNGSQSMCRASLRGKIWLIGSLTVTYTATERSCSDKNKRSEYQAYTTYTALKGMRSCSERTSEAFRKFGL